jgi:hypothetical protein
MQETLDLHQTAIAVAACARAGYVPLVLGSPGMGKCLGPDVPVLRYDGYLVPAERVRVGDVLMGPDGTPRRVLSTTRNIGPMYRITPTKGDPWTCNDVHILTVVDSVSDAVTDIPLDQYLTKPEHFKHHAKLFQPANGVDFKYVEPPPVDPYFLGLWFGDGNKPGEDYDNNFTGLKSVAITTGDPEVVATCEAVAAQWGLGLTASQKPGANCKTYRLSGGLANKGKGKTNDLLDVMRVLVGPDAVIPHAVITGSRETRLAFLAGFLDADGNLDSGTYGFTQKRGDYADAVAFIARSVGLRVTRGIKTVAGAVYHRLYISGDLDKLPLRIPRKQAAPRRQVKDALRVGFSVEAIGAGEYAGFELDGDGRFLLGDFTVTHNTSLMRAITPMIGKALGYDDAGDYPLAVCILSNREAVDIGGYPVVKSDDTVELTLFGTIAEAAEHPRALLLDEFLTCSQSVQGPALRLTLEGVAGEQALHQDTRIVAAANPPDQAPGGIQLTAALVNRLVILHCVPRVVEVASYFCGRPEASLVSDLKLPEHATFMERRAHYMDVAGILFEARPDLLCLSSPPQASISGGEPFPSPRAWEICCSVLAALPAGHVEAVSDVTRALVMGSIGPTAGVAYLTILRARTLLPTVAEVLAAPNTAKLPDPHAKIDIDGKMTEIGRDINFSAIPLVIEAARTDTFAVWVYVNRLPAEIQAAVAKNLAATHRGGATSKWADQGRQILLDITCRLAGGGVIKKAS